ncbi:MAG: lipopolysaccharide heptosyltransferase II, partial [Waddliaceae bacterium]
METTTPCWPKEKPTNIIVRMPNWLGDLVMATPVLADLRRYYPEAKITAMCQSNVSPLLAHDPNIDHLFSYSRPKGWRPSEIITFLKKGPYDLGILLTNSLSSAWWFWRGNVKNRIGFAGNLRNWLLNKAVPFPPERETRHLVLTYKHLLDPLGISVSDTSTKLYTTDEEIQKARELLSQHGIEYGKHTLFGMNPGAAYGSAKCWLPERFVDVTRRLLQNPDAYVLYFGDNAGAPVVKEICEKLPERVINLAGKTNLRELMALIKSCSAFLTNDSGPMHIAAALDTPL